MMLSQGFFRFSTFVGILIIILIIFFGYLFFEPFITEETIEIKVINKAKFGSENGKYLIFTENEVFYNADNYYHDKDNSETLDQLLYPGSTYKVKVVGMYIPWLPRFRNIIKVYEVNGVPLVNEKKFFP